MQQNSNPLRWVSDRDGADRLRELSTLILQEPVQQKCSRYQLKLNGKSVSFSGACRELHVPIAEARRVQRTLKLSRQETINWLVANGRPDKAVNRKTLVLLGGVPMPLQEALHTLRIPSVKFYETKYTKRWTLQRTLDHFEEQFQY